MILLLATACTSSGPTLDEAAQTLSKDARTLKDYSLENMRLVEENDHVEDSTACPEGNRRQTYRIVENFPTGGQATPAAWVDAIKPSIHHTLASLGYEKNDGAGREQPGRVLMVLTKGDLRITFTVLLQTAQPNIQITGKTDCLTTG